MDHSDAEESIVESCPELIEEKIVKSNGDEVTKKYTKGKFLGKGGFAKCYEFQCINNKRIYAAKIVSKANLSKSSAKQKLKSEIKIHKSLFHKHIVKFEHVFEDNDNVYILLELCKCKTLNDIMKKRKIITELEVKYFLDQILKAVNFMHKNKIIHRDLKLGNLFLNEDMEIKIGDFGLATIIEFQGQLRYTVCGTPNYIAPEILEGKNSGHSYEVDFWAIGVIVYTLLVGRPPYETDDVKETYKKIKANEYTYPPTIYVSNDAKDFISKLLVVNPSERMKVDQMRNHPFMKNDPPPKKMPTTITTTPLDSTFLKNHYIDLFHIKSTNDESKLINEQYETHLQNLLAFSKQNIIKVNNNIANYKFCLDSKEIQQRIEENEKINREMKRSTSFNYKKKGDPVSNMKFLVNYNEISYSKEFNEALNLKKSDVQMEEIYYVEALIDSTDSVGLSYMTNQGIIGVCFNDKSTIFKKEGYKNQFFYRKTTSSLVIELNSQSVSSLPYGEKEEISLKYDFLNKSEKKLLVSNTNSESKRPAPSKVQAINNIYVKKLFVSNLAYFMKLSNDFINLTFYDGSRLLIGNDNYSYVLYWDKEGKMTCCNSHRINKSKNKNMLKRYEHYKKVFYDKLEVRLSNKAATKQSAIEISDEGKGALEQSDQDKEGEEKVDLNKTL